MKVLTFGIQKGAFKILLIGRFIIPPPLWFIRRARPEHQN